MHPVAILAVKGLAGGALVCAFSVLSEMLSPKRFAGLFSAAPAVAIAGLVVVLLDRGSHPAHESAAGMIAGSFGMVAYAAGGALLLQRLRAPAASAVALAIWAAVAGILAWPLLA